MSMKHEEIINLKSLFIRAYNKDPQRFKALPGMTGTWTPKMLVDLFELMNEPGEPSQADMAAVINVNRSTITRKIASVDWGDFEEKLRVLCTGDHSDAVDMASDDYLVKIMNQQSTREWKRDLMADTVAKRVEGTMGRMLPLLGKTKFPPLKFTNKKALARTPEEMVLLLSDLHVGYTFSKNETGSLSEYNLDVFRKRADGLRRGVLEIMRLHKEMRKIPVLHVFGLGDFVHGLNLAGKWGPAYTTEDITKQTMVAGSVIAEAMDAWGNYFDRVEFDGVLGNHGRAGVNENSDKVSANWDRMVYNQLQLHLKNRPNIHINFNESWWTRKTIQGFDFLLLHGDHIRGGIPSLLKVNYELQDLQQEKPFNYLCMGHFHACREIETPRGGIIINGSFLKGDMYSLHKLRVTSMPRQIVFGVHPEHGVSWTYKLDLDFARG